MTTKIDNISYHFTPEGTTLSLMPAGVVPRLGAWLIDMVVRALIVVLLWVLFWALGEVGAGLMMIAYFFIEWLYPVLFEVYRDGQTIGKKYFAIKVCQDDGMAVGWRISMIRNLLRVADFLPFMFVSAALCMLFNGQNKRIGDMVAGTMVVYVHKEKVGFDIAKKPPSTPKIPLYLEEQQAILAFAERRDELPEKRQQELAQILTPLSHYDTPQAISDEIVGFANAIIGRK